MSSDFWWNWWVQVAVAVGTTAAAAVALFGDAARRRLFPPKLKLSLLDEKGEKTVVVWLEPNATKSADVRYYHLQVSNGRRWSPATDVQILLLKVEKKHLSGKYHQEWSGSVPLIWRHQDVYPTLRTVGAPADADVVSVRSDGVLTLQLLVNPFNLAVERRGTVDCILTLQVRSNEADSDIMRLRVAWDGQWEDGSSEMAKHLELELMPTGPKATG